MELSREIDVVTNISQKEFNEKYYSKHKPVVIKGLLNNTFAGEHWSIEYFKKTMGDTLVDVYDNGNKNTSATAFTCADLKMPFRDYLNSITKDEKSNLRIFLYNIFKSNPRLSKEFPCPPIVKNFLCKMGFIFFGGKNTTVRIHYDVDMSNVLHTHFGGKKRVVLFAPEYSRLLYCLPLNTYSLIDIDHIDYEKYPGLKYVNGLEIILEHGDTLYMPAGYWHYMTYLESSFSVSYRKPSLNLKYPLQGLINLGILMPIDKLLNKLFGKKWLDMKIAIADKRAKEIIYEKEVPGYSNVFDVISKNFH